MDFSAVMRIKQAWDVFTANHPKFPGFMNALKARGIHEDDIVAITITAPNGEKLETNIKVKAGDLEMFEMLKGMGSMMK